MAEHNETGKAGEEIAAAYLKEKGFKILELNWRFRNLEADIIAIKEDLLILAEVKTRRSILFGEPEVFVDRRKQQHLIKAANAYLQEKRLDLEVRFDILAVHLFQGKAQVNHLERAFYPRLGR